jgi:C4-dicarboxylate-specific signal transduction histidine kinase
MLAAHPASEPAGRPPLRSTELTDAGQLATEYARLRERVESMEQRLHKGEQRRRALLHLIGDVNEANKRLANQRKAMLHILADYESDRRRLAQQAERLDNSRRALLHILQDSHRSKLRLEESRKAMIHIMGDLRETTDEVQRRVQELREKQEQLVQAGKLATLGELTTGVAHELNNPLNNIGLFIGNVADLIELQTRDPERMLRDLGKALDQVRKASQIISHLRTFGRVAPASREQVSVKTILLQALSLLHEQLRLRNIEVRQHLCREDALVMGNAIQLEQVFLNLLTNARDALAESPEKVIHIGCSLGRGSNVVRVQFRDTGPGIPVGLEGRIFDPFFTTKEVGAGTGLGLSITYGIVRDHQGTISVESQPRRGAVFLIELPLVAVDGQTTGSEAAA